MAISETNALKNNKDLTQHFLYTYSHINKIGPTERVRRFFNEDLIFDRSRRSIFTQSQEFGYISDTLSSVSVGNDQNNGNAFVTLRSYEGSIELYKYTPVKITSVNIANILPADKVDKDILGNDIYPVNTNFTPSLIQCSYIGDAPIEYCELKFNNETLKLKPTASSSGSFTCQNPGFKGKFVLGKNSLQVFCYSYYRSYLNDNPDNQHATNPRFQITNNYSSDTYTCSLYAYNYINIVKFPQTYWTIMDNKNAYNIDDSNTVNKRIYNDYTQLSRYLCKNNHNETLCLVLPQRISQYVEADGKTKSNHPIIYGFLGGTSTEFMFLKTANYSGEPYNYYLATSDNWNGQYLSF